MQSLVSARERVSPGRALIPQQSVLLVDLDADDRERYARHLRDRELRVRACSTYEEAGQYLERERYSLVIVDQGGPGFEGKVVAARSIMKDRTVPVLVITRHHQMAAYLEAMRLGAVDYLEKPIPWHEFIWRVGTYLPSGWVKVQRPN